MTRLNPGRMRTGARGSGKAARRARRHNHGDNDGQEILAILEGARTTTQANSTSRRRPPPTKKQLALSLLKRSKGANIAEMQKALGWQAHSVRGFLAGTVKKMPSLTLVSDKIGNGPRRYRIQAVPE